MEKAWDAVGKAACEYVENGMLVGLGTGRTATAFIKHLGTRVREGLSIHAVASSLRSQQLAKTEGIPLSDTERVTAIDLTIDGADEVDPQKRLIKGGGGALLREKVLASLSKRMIVIVDETKCVKQLGKFPIPLEVLSFATKGILHRVQSLGYQGELRKTEEGKFYVTDNGNLIFDLHLGSLPKSPEEMHLELIQIPGILETGLFCGYAEKVLVGKTDGSIEILQ